jgi:hypothetical protein
MITSRRIRLCVVRTKSVERPETTKGRLVFPGGPFGSRRIGTSDAYGSSREERTGRREVHVISTDLHRTSHDEPIARRLPRGAAGGFERAGLAVM